jgi:hypothetical protein
MQRSRVSAEASFLLLALAAAAAWLLAMWFYLSSKGSFFDDTFIYLHIANNAIETGTARYFPSSGSSALIASSPLRLLSIIPAAFVASLVTDARSLAGATLTMYLSGLVASLIYLPFYRHRIRRWLVGLTAAGIVCVSCETGLQMEGTLLFWAAYTLVMVWREPERDGPFYLRLGSIAGLLVLTRPEYGLVAVVFLLVHVLMTARKGALLQFAYPVIVCGLSWIAVALLLRVYPVPTSFITKALTLKSALFSGSSLGPWLGARMRTIFAVGDIGRAALACYFAAVFAVLMTCAPAVRWGAAGLLFVLALLWNGPGLYIWYYENLTVVLLALCLGALLIHAGELRAFAQQPWQWRLRAARVLLVATPIVLFLETGFLRDRRMFWDFHAEMSRGLSYRAIGEASLGHGRFRFPDRTGYLMMSEIGIAAFFAGNDTWLYDRGGLAQPGEIEGIAEHPLAVFYPRSLFRNPIDEFMLMFDLYEAPDAGDEVALFFARGNPGREDIPVMCDRYYPDTGVCLKYLQSLVRVDTTAAPAAPSPVDR